MFVQVASKVAMAAPFARKPAHKATAFLAKRFRVGAPRR